MVAACSAAGCRLDARGFHQLAEFIDLGFQVSVELFRCAADDLSPDIGMTFLDFRVGEDAGEFLVQATKDGRRRAGGCDQPGDR